MEKIIQFTTTNEENAFEIIKKLKYLDDNNEIKLGEYYIFQKDNEGKVTLKSGQQDVLGGAVFGALTGGLFGALFGPYGLLLGSAFGTLSGAVVDTVTGLKEADYLDKVTEKMSNNHVVIVAQIIEQWVTPIDASIGDLAEIKRAYIDDAIEQQINDNLDELNKNIDEVEAKIQSATGDAKAKLTQELDALKAKHDERSKQIHAKIDAQKQAVNDWTQKMHDKGIEIHSKAEDAVQAEIDSLNSNIEATKQKINDATDEAKATLEAKINELKTQRDEKIKHYHEMMQANNQAYDNWVQGMKDKGVDIKNSIETQAKAEVDAINSELDAAKQQIKTVGDNTKAQVQQKISELEAKRDEKIQQYHDAVAQRKQAYNNWVQAMTDKGEAVSDQLETNLKGKIDSLNNSINETEQKIKNAQSDAKAKLEQEAQALKAKRDEHIEHLHHTMTAQNEKFKGWLNTAKDKLSFNK